MFKGLHLTETKIPCTVNFQLLRVKASSSKMLYIMPQIKRGKQDAIKLRSFQVQPSTNKKVTELGSLNLAADFEISLFMKKDEAMPKTC